MGKVATMRRGLLLGCWLALLAAAGAGAGEDRYTAFLSMTPEKQTAYAKNKVKKTGLYFSCKLGRYVINSEVSPADSCRWALMLDNYTDELISEGIVPKKKLNPGDPQVYVLKTQASYQRALDDFWGEHKDAGWSGGMFTLIIRGNTLKPGLFAFYEQFRPAAEKTDKASADQKKGDKKDSGKDEDKKTDEESDLVSVKTGNGELSTKEYAGMSKVLLHESTHQMIFYHLGTAVPVWFNEGMATNFETYDCDMSFKANLYNAMYVSRRADAAVIYLEKNLLKSFQKIFFMSSERWLGSQGEDVYVNYATAWAACNYIFTTRGGRKFVDAYMGALVKLNMTSRGESVLTSIFPNSVLEELDGDIRTHVSKVLLPACKYGRSLRQVLNAGDVAKAEPALAKMKEEFPDSLEMKFYQVWLDLLQDKDPAGNLKLLDGLRNKNTDFNHPEFNYVVALGLYKSGSGSKMRARSAIDEALKTNATHAAALALKEQIINMK